MIMEINSEGFKPISINSNPIKVLPGKKYQISTKVLGSKGTPFSAYFGVVFLNQKGEEVDRKIRWLNDFSGSENNVSLVTKAITDRLTIIYRINLETPVKSDSFFKLLPTEEVTIKQVESEQEKFDDLNYVPTRPRPKELSSEEESILESNLVWLLGSPRSGTSWLGLKLLSYQTNQIDHPHITEHLGTPHVGIMDLVIGRWVDRCKNNDGYFFNNQHKETWRYFLRKLILNRVFSQINDINHKIILKEPSVASGADLISECLPNSKFIILLRDSRDIIDSIIDAKKPSGFMTKMRDDPPISKDYRMKFIETRSKLWLKLIENLMNVYEKHSKNFRIIVKYEDLLKDTFGELKKIYKFLEIDISENKLKEIIEKYSFKNIPEKDKGVGKSARSATPGKWEEHFSDEEKELMQKIMGVTLKKIGY